jgi:restriction system protein
VARRGGAWANLQRQRARQQRMDQQLQRSAAQAQARGQRELERTRRLVQRQAAANERERKRLYIEDRRAQADETTADLAARVDELDALLASGLSRPTPVTFNVFRRTVPQMPFDPGNLRWPNVPPDWARLAPQQPSGLGRMFGGNTKYERELASARAQFEYQKAQHAHSEAERLRLLEQRHQEHERLVAQTQEAVRQHNADIDQFEADFWAGDSSAVAQFFTLVLDSIMYPEGFPHQTRVLYRGEPRELVIDYELPGQDVIPSIREYRYVQRRDAIDELTRPIKEVKDRYAYLIARVALRTMHEIFAVSTDLVGQVTFNGRVSTKDKATGKAVRPHLISVSATREIFSELVLTDLDPVWCLRKLNALVSPDPYYMEPVRPTVDVDVLMREFATVEGMDAVAGLDGRTDLLDMSPTEFEHLVRQLFEAMGMKTWATQASNDEGVDAVAINEDPVFGGMCIVQAKRYRSAVGVDAVRELAGTMEDKRATKGIMVTTSWVTKGGHEYAERHKRIQIIEYGQLILLIKENLGLDVIIGLPKPPPQRKPNP